MAFASTQSDRATRYRTVLAEAARDEQFSLASLKLCLREEHPAFVTRTVKALVHDGFLTQTTDGPKASYRWVARHDANTLEAWINCNTHTTQIKNSPVADRPRERLLANGASTLRIAELLAILIRTGRAGESALQSGEKLAAAFATNLEKLNDAGRGELKVLSSAVGDSAYCQIMAGIELGRRVAELTAQPELPTKISGSADAIRYCTQRFERLAHDGVQEEFHIVTLDTKNQVIGSHQISVGTLDASLIHPREVFRPAIKDAAASVVLCHNHPSGDPTPSSQDFEITERLDAAGRMLGIQVVDHVVLGATDCLSIREAEASVSRRR